MGKQKKHLKGKAKQLTFKEKAKQLTFKEKAKQLTLKQMDKTIVENFVKASEIKIKISNKFDKNFNGNGIDNELRNLVIEILICPELFEFFGKDICEVLNKNKNKFELNSINEILSVFWKNT